MEETGREMPRYRCHKEVWALKIKEVRDVYPTMIAAGGVSDIMIIPEDKGYGPLICSSEYAAKHKPEAGGYYVVYADGYKSYSPAKAFEEGYTRI